MSKQLSERIKYNLDISLKTVGDMALKRRARKVIEGFELRSRDKILEIGCGNGYYLSLLNRMGMKLNLIGIDNCQLALDDAKKYIGDDSVKLILCDAAKLPFKNNSFDKILMSEVIEHVENEELVIKEALRVLKKGGIMTLTTCNIEYPFLWDPVNWVLQRLFNKHIKSGFWAGIWNQHTRLYELSVVERLVQRAGFNIEEAASLTGWCLPFNHYLVNLVAKLFYAGKLPQSLSKGMNKFKNSKQSIIIRILFYFVNFVDKINDLLPLNIGVSIFIKAKKL